MLTRRQVLAAAAAAGSSAFLPSRGHATPALRDETLASLTGGANITHARVTLIIPGVAENGLSVFTTIHVDSPMTATDYVRKIHILSAQNPVAHLASFELGPRAGVAEVSTNIRLAASQEVTALVEMNDGSFWRDSQQVVVAIAACIDGG
jgi:sulfur-oxidizing protein SoxY